MTDVVDPSLARELKEHMVNMESHYSRLIANPYRSQEVIDEMRKTIVRTASTLMQHNIPLEIPKKERTVSDILQEAAAETGMLLGSRAVAQGVSFFRNVQDMVNQPATPKEKIVNEEEITIYEDQDGNLFFIDEDGNEIECDEWGDPLED